ncbi:hypothetical protein [Thermodesulfobacterium hydrogeniphilum]|uniref:hypothetical protein n=1 Tax=Thermodesulfobacterium hydrogeniphilum TaxID=161156 RepID=UPI00056E868C|nr:hypothetical protein [Thermodesulfobacterium hydrogeniphilum]
MKFKREHKLKVVAFLIATTLWYFVVWGKPIEKNIEIPITYKPINSKYLIEISPSSVILRVVAIRRILINLSKKNLKIEIDVSKYAPGIYQIRVPIEKINLPQNVKIKEVNPNFITIVVKKISTKKVPIKVSFEDSELLNSTKFKINIIPSYAIIKAPIDILSHTKAIYTKPINFLKLKLIKKMEVEIVPPLGTISINPEKVKVIYKEKEK